MAAGNVKFLLADMRGDYRQVAVIALNLSQEVLQPGPQGSTPWKPKRKARSYLLAECAQFKVLAQLAVVSLLGLFQHFQVLVKHALLREGYTVDTGELLALLVSPPVSAGYRGELDGLDYGCRHDVRASAKVGEVTVGIE